MQSTLKKQNGKPRTEDHLIGRGKGCCEK